MGKRFKGSLEILNFLKIMGAVSNLSGANRIPLKDATGRTISIGRHGALFLRKCF